MLTRRALAKFVGAAALSGGMPLGLAARAIAQSAAAPRPRGAYLIKNGAVVTVDEALGTLQRADVLVRDGRIAGIGPDLAATDAEVIDATDMIVMPGFVDTHYHMWSALGRNFIGDGGFGYFPAKNATSKLYSADDFSNSVMLGLVELANAGITTVHNWSHNTRTPAHADAELRAHRDSMLRARYAYGHIDQMPRDQVLDFTDIDRVKRDYFAGGTAFDGLLTFGVNLRGLSQSEERTYHQDMAAAMERAGAWADAPGWRGRVEADADRLVAAWRQVPRTLVAVSEEVGWGAVPTFASGRRYANALGRLNQRLAAESERVLLVVAGRAHDLRNGAPGHPLPVPEHDAAGPEAAG